MEVIYPATGLRNDGGETVSPTGSKGGPVDGAVLRRHNNHLASTSRWPARIPRHRTRNRLFRGGGQCRHPGLFLLSPYLPFAASRGARADFPVTLATYVGKQGGGTNQNFRRLSQMATQQIRTP